MASSDCPLCWIEAHAGNPANPFPSRLWKGKEIYWLEEGKLFGEPIYKVMRGHWAKPVMQTTDRERAERRRDAENADIYLRSRLGDRKYLIGIAERVGLTEEELEGFSNVSVMGEIIGSNDFKNIARELAENIHSTNPSKPDEALIKKCKEQFGVTDNPDDAGYLLPDGSWLDFGKSLKKIPYEKHPFYWREKAHGEISLCMTNLEGLDTHKIVNKFIGETGAIRTWMHRVPKNPRLDTFNFHVHSANDPTPAQMRKIGSLCRDIRCSWDVYSPEGVHCRGSGGPKEHTRMWELKERVKQCREGDEEALLKSL